jgi:hypothetical protein
MNDKYLKYSDIFFDTDCLSFDQMIAYKAGNLSKEETHRVECHLIDCAFCSEALEGVEKLKNIKKAKSTIRRTNRKIVKEIYRSADSRKSKKTFQYIAIAATFIAFMSIFFFYNSKDESDVLFNKHFDLYPNLVPIIRGETEESLFIYAMQAYETKRFRQAELLFTQIGETDEKYFFATFYRGIIALKNEDYTKSSFLFNKILKSEIKILHKHVKWYLVLNYMKSERYVLCRYMLIELINSNSVYTKPGIEILRFISSK